MNSNPFALRYRRARAGFPSILPDGRNNYVVQSRLCGDTVEVLRVFHTPRQLARKW
jgi:hypothetical protein